MVEGGRDEVVKSALELAKVIAMKSPVAVSSSKHLLTHSRDHRSDFFSSVFFVSPFTQNYSLFFLFLSFSPSFLLALLKISRTLAHGTLQL